MAIRRIYSSWTASEGVGIAWSTAEIATVIYSRPRLISVGDSQSHV